MNNYTKGTLPGKQDEPEAHWAWDVAGAVLAMVALSWLGAWIAERLAS